MPMLAVGCSQKAMSPADMKPPPRPAELDKLSMFVGTWSTESEMTMKGSDKPMKGTGTSTSEWACDQRFLMGRMTGNMGDMGTMTGVEMWTWDPGSKKYKQWWFDSFGSAATGEATVDASGRNWTMTWQGKDPAGNATYGKGTCKFVNDKTMEWEFKEWNNSFRWGDPTMHGKGTSKKS